MAQQPPIFQNLLIIETSPSHSDTPQSVGLLRTSDQPYAETCTWQHTTLARDRYPSAPAEFETAKPTKRAAADPRFRQRSHWVRHETPIRGI